MEICKIGSLFDIMRLTGSSFTEKEVSFVCLSILNALDWMHDHNIAHRDIKPQNIYLNGSGKVKLGDLGICREMDKTGHLTDMIGSLMYLAPEVVLEVPYTTKVDIWSLGITAMELAQGHSPRNTLKSYELIKQLRSPYLVTELDNSTRFSASFVDFLKLLLNPDPEKRLNAKTLLDHPFLKISNENEMQNVVEKVSHLVNISGSFEDALEGVIASRKYTKTFGDSDLTISSHGSSTEFSSSFNSSNSSINQNSTTSQNLTDQNPSMDTNSSIEQKKTNEQIVLPKFIRPLLGIIGKKKKSIVFDEAALNPLLSPRLINVELN